MQRNRKFVVLGLLSSAAVLLAALVVGYARQDALAEDAGTKQGPPTLLAATGACGIGGEVGVLFLVDSEKKQLAVYGAFGGRNLEFVAARKIFYDLELLEANDETSKGYTVKNLKRAFEQFEKAKKEEAEGPRRR